MRAGARLHLGFYSFRVDRLGRVYGGMGVAVEEPHLELEARECSRRFVSCPDPLVKEVIEEFLSTLRLDVCIDVKSYIPRHVGLGSTTQTLLATSVAVSTLLDLDLDLRTVAVAFGRGPVSGVGLGTFMLGGFVVDSGTSLDALRKYPALDPEDLPKIVARLDVPQSWRFLIVIPRGRGLSEEEEASVLAEPRELDENTSRELLEDVFLGMLPALARGDPIEFGRALTRVQHIVGTYFSREQGGVFAKPYGEAIAKALTECGSLCVGQSSWGPAMYGLAEDELSGARLRECVENELRRLGIEARLVLTPPRNKGFEVSISD